MMYKPETLIELAEQLDACQKNYQILIEALIVSALGTEPERCNKCNRFMIPRRTWDDIDRETRKPLWRNLSCAHSKGRCRTCISYMHRKRDHSEGVLSEAELANLRRLAAGRAA